jgi:hypothetical protein
MFFFTLSPVTLIQSFTPGGMNSIACITIFSASWKRQQALM